jgi:hypothetical protein
MTDIHETQEIHQKIQDLEDFLGELRSMLGARRTALTNADKKLQQFQDTIYAMLIEDEYPSRRSHRSSRRIDSSRERETDRDGDQPF